MSARVVRIGIVGSAGAATLTGVAGIALHFLRWPVEPLVLAASGAPYLMAVAVLGVVGFAAARQWLGTGVAVLVTAVGAATQVPLYVADGGRDGHAIVAMQANLLFDGADPTALVEQVRTRDIALLTVNELTRTAVDDLSRAGLDRLLPHRYLAPGQTASGTGIWSRYPLSDTVEYDGFVLNQISATAQIPEAGPVAVYAFHPVPPIYDSGVWAAELARLHAILRRAPTDRPVIIGGDFNATHDHARFRAMASDRFADAAAQAGAGHLRTYPTDKRFPPLVGIDHFLLADAHATAVETVELPGADHRALVARIVVERVGR
ncbi:endonuclease/exonuclease/phosphatase family protein [Nocardia mangyaensis]|uniref:endonuclease/exonuclease/phosphatase family protein n=1 Tax=Nocardia mangyaensis TaxID=2213200 RepID=UPI00267453B4|nr:endonuclease/exonuclease/phosphatase family protein [Nocardia mangyaensis]MDO3646359.1 endonuclease/exonuclease/phosphatase family protein [Nocardia mangyaensis]